MGSNQVISLYDRNIYDSNIPFLDFWASNNLLTTGVLVNDKQIATKIICRLLNPNTAPNTRPMTRNSIVIPIVPNTDSCNTLEEKYISIMILISFVTSKTEFHPKAFSICFA